MYRAWWVHSCCTTSRVGMKGERIDSPVLVLLFLVCDAIRYDVGGPSARCCDGLKLRPVLLVVVFMSGIVQCRSVSITSLGEQRRERD